VKEQTLNYEPKGSLTSKSTIKRKGGENEDTKSVSDFGEFCEKKSVTFVGSPSVANKSECKKSVALIDLSRTAAETLSNDQEYRTILSKPSTGTKFKKATGLKEVSGTSSLEDAITSFEKATDSQARIKALKEIESSLSALNGK